tara:strand:- start:2364 stop:2792 length:429 start_codon:yes stop_codon:yes gene_type:complete
MASSRDAKIAKVMGEFKRGTLKSSSGKKVTNRKQALAIANSEGDRVMAVKQMGKVKGTVKKGVKVGKFGALKKQGGGSAKKKPAGKGRYNARLDDSLGARNRKTKGKLGARRRESEGMEKKLGRRKFAAVKTMDKGRRKRKA